MKFGQLFRSRHNGKSSDRRPTKPAPTRKPLQLEALEDRTLLDAGFGAGPAMFNIHNNIHDSFNNGSFANSFLAQELSSLANFGLFAGLNASSHGSVNVNPQVSSLLNQAVNDLKTLGTSLTSDVSSLGSATTSSLPTTLSKITSDLTTT